MPADCMNFDNYLPPSTLASVGTAVWHEFSHEMRFYEVLGTKTSSRKAKEGAAKVQFTPEAYSRVYKAFFRRTDQLSTETLRTICRAASGRGPSVKSSALQTKPPISHMKAAAKDADDLASCLGLPLRAATEPSFIDPSLLDEAARVPEYNLDLDLDQMEEVERIAGDADMINYGMVRIGRLWPSGVSAQDVLDRMESGTIEVAEGLKNIG
ncbi:hypothetical protein BT69DRAFT_607541 [Atractiella rhizophila]|nr:hypothetical protein BT69DRAFT_607541 [Atractiella rhizophila]